MTMTSNEAYESANELLLHAGVRACDFDARALHRVRNALWELHERTDDPREVLALAERRYAQIGTSEAMASDFALDLRQAWMQIAFYVRRGLRSTAAA